MLDDAIYGFHQVRPRYRRPAGHHLADLLKKEWIGGSRGQITKERNNEMMRSPITAKITRRPYATRQEMDERETRSR
jgi:hypothetical protein